ncbi:hypothetical protein LUZ63_019332 [Rhynchospora breviuscula]|uniref:Reverse transcriptase domain-containing protein n=1 Tax=Rhynchospora breviuscula TaxID=2022672 RepID=A0A9Q0HIX2_9POAL|nr:hypothetical protein LUZ63_019332 [Rhynchospora breviuscula]
MLISAYSNTKIKILINGSGDGFIRPTRGLRQGCPMSPYIFILTMEILSRILQISLQNRVLKGLRLAATAPYLTHIMYADDLIILGTADREEIQNLKHILMCFGEASGLEINPAKSKLWFTKTCHENMREMIITEFQAQLARNDEKYLGAFVMAKGGAKRTENMLIDRLTEKFAGWKCSMLSHAGHLVLIKSVLTSLPVYYMSTKRLPRCVLNKMSSLIAKFFWGKIDKTRYLAFVSWKSICKPIEEGGLGVRDLVLFGDALFLKNAWDLMRQGDKLWVKVCQAKYYPKIGFWKAKNTNGASSLWREVVKVRHHLQDDVRWEINNGGGVQALSQPWFPNWEVHQNYSPRETVKKVSELLHSDTGLWNLEELHRLFGRERAVTIQTQIKPPDLTNEVQDRLIWHKSKKGKYSVKEGYNQLFLPAQQGTQANIGVQWSIINRWKFLAPKVKLFLWRMLSRALPLASNLHSRIMALSPLCQRCGEENEYESHCFFYCPGSRRVWFEGKLGLRTHDQPLDITQAFTQTVSLLDEDGIKLYCYTLWELWKGRNEVIMQHKRFDPAKILRAVSNWTKEGVLERQQSSDLQQTLKLPGYEVQKQDWLLIVDASWQQSGKAGIAYILYEKGKVSQWCFNYCEAHDPFHAEALAMLHGFNLLKQKLQQNQDKKVNVCSDCQNLVEAVNEMHTENIPSWRAMPVVQELISVYKSCIQNITVRFVKRDAVKPPHIMANFARRVNQAKEGNALNCNLLFEMGIGLEIDKNFFEIT